ncbi:hypothetical protein [Erythrobacter sp.]|jgi:hypothetical protein|uniref:hypothetical protein n=1 Tax=Erythrobacter sp. TaxID=1042 RepID=UPI002EAA7280|nr:hypothetical protein [Erythrobacter sp.]
MNRAWTLAALGASTLIAACSSQEEEPARTPEELPPSEYTIDEETGETSMTVMTEDGEVSLRSGVRVPVDLPAGFTLIEGARVVSNTVIDQGDTKGALVTFASDQSPQEIVQYYRAQGLAAGMAIEIESEMNGVLLVGGEHPATGSTFSISAYAGDDGTTAQLTAGEEPG